MTLAISLPTRIRDCRNKYQKDTGNDQEVSLKFYVTELTESENGVYRVPPPCWEWMLDSTSHIYQNIDNFSYV